MGADFFPSPPVLCFDFEFFKMLKIVKKKNESKFTKFSGTSGTEVKMVKKGILMIRDVYIICARLPCSTGSFN